MAAPLLAELVQPLRDSGDAQLSDAQAEEARGRWEARRATSLSRQWLEQVPLAVQIQQPLAHVGKAESAYTPHGDGLTAESGPAALFRATLARWGLSNEQASSLLGLEPFHNLRIQDVLSRSSLTESRDLKDRLKAILLLRRLLTGLYRDNAEAEVQWLRRPSPDLKDRTPLEIMTEDGIEGLLLVRNYLRWHSGL